MHQFKKTLSTLGVCAAMMMAAQANAANDVSLQVSGNVVPTACTPALSNSGEVDFGSISASSIRHPATGNNLVQLGSRKITLTVSCDAAAAVGFRMVDNRAGSAVVLASSTYIVNPNAGGLNFTESYFGFGLGKTNGKNTGTYTVIADTATVTIDGVNADVIFSEDSGSSWRTGSNYITQRPEAARILTAATKGSASPALFNEMVIPLKISAGMQPSSVLGFDEIVLDGSATMSLVYL